jgi:hypothetical protein
LTPEFLTSPRDNEPIVIRVGAPASKGEEYVIAHEKFGAGGERFVLFGGNYKVDSIDSERAKRLGIE